MKVSTYHRIPSTEHSAYMQTFVAGIGHMEMGRWIKPQANSGPWTWSQGFSGPEVLLHSLLLLCFHSFLQSQSPSRVPAMCQVRIGTLDMSHKTDVSWWPVPSVWQHGQMPTSRTVRRVLLTRGWLVCSEARKGEAVTACPARCCVSPD